MIQLIRGFKDILPGETALWQKIEETAKGLFEDFGYSEIRLPILEQTELFARSIGENTDIVEKEMYTFPDGRRGLITLRPEATASAVRSYIQHKMYGKDPVQKLYTVGPMFRRERPQKGRYRQFYQIDAEVFGIESPHIDAQIIFMLVSLFKRLDVSDVNVHLNSLGCPCCRPKYKEALIALIGKAEGELCSDCARRKDKNPLRVLDCKVPACREAVANAPSILEYLCADCDKHFTVVKSALEKQGVAYKIDSNLVRGLDYYTRTIFEIQTTSLGAQSAVAGGGRYDGLIEALGGPSQPAIGFAIGFDRLVEIMAQSSPDLSRKLDLFIIAVGEKAKDLGYEWGCELALSGVLSDMDMGDRSLKSLMKRADKLKAANVLIVGDRELEEGAVTLRNMGSRDQVSIPLDGVVEGILKALPQRD